MNAIGNSTNDKKIRYQQMASEYLTSNKEKCYLASYTHIDDDGEVVTHDVEFFIPLTKEEIENAKTAFQVCKEEGIDIGDYYDNEEDIPYYMRMEDDVFGYHELNNIDLQTIGYRCLFKVACFDDSIDDSPNVLDFDICLPQDKYIELLTWHLLHRRLSFNDLSHSAPELFSYINGRIRSMFSIDYMQPLSTPTYAVDMTEIKQIAYELVGEAEVQVNHDLYEGDEIQRCISVIVCERKLSLSYITCNEGHVHDESVEEVDAIALQRVLGVDNYKGIEEYIAAHFINTDCVAGFCKFLDDSNIAYKRTSFDYDI